VETSGIPADQVLAQNPVANDTQVLAPRISLLLSTAADPQVFVMPSFVGQPLGSASRILQDNGFKLGNVSVAAPVTAPVAEDPNAALPPSTQLAPAPAEPSPASIVVSQAPAAGQKVSAGTYVSFEVR
jgi:beta-lactam-binding protein with PASTA domain